ncbi:related to RRB1 - involved in the regulation of ribosome biosynthesis [Melanopsichium pennsylvanicum]|uniref:Glutamate-rich WD repeat-containing protein 1 n=2 Tax=Melanopsichium pennsylvanicum TaxID=63383 RepID=A0AAJ4XL75_9BASI|nr:related to RRB1-involved in the regulation of ribosome biosynthesis [Melanopsichium pennsylvanicum 4]SNX84205.1 related to RRB1 - involved in the regulation of ribosome biosynthesis [Melanopsichium pennsylvanicum]
MSKRPSSPSLQGPSTTNSAPSTLNRIRDADADQDMGEFEDQFEDEFEEEPLPSTSIPTADSDEDDDEDDDDDADTMDVDGIKVDGKIQRPEDQDVESIEPESQVFIPGVNKLEQGQTLEPDQSAYEMLHRLNVNWPCLSFDHLNDHLGNHRQAYPHTSYMVAGTQADLDVKNEILVMKASSLHKTQNDDGLSDDEDDDENALDDDAILEYKSIPVHGGINRIRAAPTSTPVSDLEPCLDPYPVAAWNEKGHVSIFDVRPLLNSLDRPGTSYDSRKVNTPMFTIKAHNGVEGYAMDWAGVVNGGSSFGGKASSLRLLTGDVNSNIFLTTANNAGFTTNPVPFTSHTSSVEDLQWSPKEPTVFASCSADGSIRIWDVRVKSRKSVISVESAHSQDVNVISWNKGTDYLLVSGGDEASLKVWDLRHFKPNSSTIPSPVAQFDWHKAPISSVEWHPTEDSIFAAAGRDDQVTLWDLSVEQDDDEEQQQRQQQREVGLKDVPPQLLFCHHGLTDCKELHWHSQVPGMLATTALDGFNIFKTISV